MNTISFTCTALHGTGKQGILKPDDDGYWTVPLGGLNVMNSMGHYYTYEGAKDLFLQSGAFIRRIKSGHLKSEEGHPMPLPNQTEESYYQRVCTIVESNVCAHIAEVWLDFDSVRDATGRKIVAIMGKVKGSGPHGLALETSLRNRREDVCFSVRGFTADKMIGGIKHRALREIITWDRVGSPGISSASKYHSPALENFIDRQVEKETLRRAFIPTEKTEALALATESSLELGRSLLHTLGWDYDMKKIPKSLLDW